MDVDNGRYRIAESIGSGGTGEVFRATDTVLGRTVAIKVLKDSLDPEVMRREARAVAGLDHPNIVAIHDLLEKHGRTHLVMEFVDGVSLADRLDRQGPLDLDQALQVIRQVGQGVAWAHGSGVLHCDIKPANVLLAASGAIKLADFTLARHVGQDTLVATIGATGAFAAPEQLDGRAIDRRSDIFALGRLLDTILGPAMPSHPGAVGRRSVRDRAVRQAIEKATARDPDDRFPTVEAFLDALPPFRRDVTQIAAMVSGSEVTRIVPPAPRAHVPTSGSHLRRSLWAAVAVCAMIVAAISGTGLINHFSVAASPERVTVPNLVHMQVGNARQVTDSLQLRAHRILRYSSLVPAGDVISQRPAPGTGVLRHAGVTLIVSRGPRPIAVPDLSGMSRQVAVDALTGRGFRVKIVTSTTVFQQSGNVVSQYPASGTMRLPGAGVTITVTQKPCWMGVIAC